MNKWINFFLIQVYIRYASPSCDIDEFGQYLFGTNCTYLCHCADDEQCDDVTGECETGCADYWMGPGCQYRDIARDKNAYQLDTFLDNNATLAIDGNMSTCSETNVSVAGSTRPVSPFWRLLLGNIEAIRAIQITPSPDSLNYFVEGFNITVENITSVETDINVKYPTASRLCYNHLPNKSIQTTFEITCDSYLFGNQIRIQLSGVNSQLALCDIKVYGGRNVAFKQAASQVGNYPWCTCPASFAVDGYTENNYTVCTHSITKKPHWWMVNFKHLVFVNAINIFMYSNPRLNYYDLQIRKDESDKWSSMYTDRNRNPTLYKTFSEHTYGLRIFRKKEEKLRLCEVQLFGDCPNFKCGFDCSINCYCKKVNYQELVSGNCTLNCLDRWWGYKGKCDQECPSTHWGPECENKCGYCYDNVACDFVNGTCSNGCAEGYIASESCMEECENGTFGSNCTGTCNSTCANSCSRVDGVCIGGCKSGWEGTFCESECENGTFGSNYTCTCNSTCANSCSRVDRVCIGGCKSGWEGTFCESECGDRTFGPSCTSTCNVTCATGCSRFTGQCEGGCESGWTGDFCQYECNNGTFGTNCTGTCNVTCANSCGHVDGACIGGCKSGWTGTFCESECSAGTWGRDCNNTCGNCEDQPCDIYNGSCPGSCKFGYQPTPLCEQVCDIGTFGENCTEVCNTTCFDSCNHVHGKCSNGCISGWKGNHCENECSAGTWGRDCNNTCGNCEDQPCDIYNGSCPGSCKSGYQPTPLCEQECSAGTWGRDCNNTCGNCEDQPCDIYNGTCPGSCKSGYQPTPLCEQECPDGYHGKNCTSQCGLCRSDTPCNRLDGTCLHGCAEKYQGLFCDEPIQEQQSRPSPTTTIVGTTVGMLVLLCVFFVILFIIKRKKRLTRNPLKPHQEPRIKIEWSKESDSNNLQYVNFSQIVPNGSSVSENDDSLSTGDARRTYSNDGEDRYTGDTYQNIVTNQYIEQTVYVELSQLKEYIFKNTKTTRFADEFKSLPQDLQFPTEHALKPTNKSKNRYKDMYPYDDVRVLLKTIPNKPDSDYVNASYIDGHKRKQKYIAAQGPFEKNMDDFWRMIWEKKIDVIVMLTNAVENGKMKCLEYWNARTYGGICVDQVCEETASDMITRTISYSSTTNGGQSIVTQFHFTAWPDKSIPEEVTGLVWFLHKCRAKYETSKSPVLIHCSAGIGRTGTFIALDYLFDQGKDLGRVSVLETVQKLRKQRLNMVQTKSQYAFLHEAAYFALLQPGPIKLCNFETHYQRLCEVDLTSRQIRLLDEYEQALDELLSTQYYNDMKSTPDKSSPYSAAKLPENVQKNRFDNILAADKHRPFLATLVEDCNNYINAVFIQSYRDPCGFIISQSALPGTVVDCCRLVFEQEINCVVTFDHEQLLQDEMYLPEEGSVEIGPFTVIVMSSEDKPGFTTRVHRLSYKNKHLEVRQHIYTDWEGNKPTPDTMATFLSLLAETRECYDVGSERKLLVQCQNGAQKSGLFVVMMNVMETLRIDGEVAILQIVRRARKRRQQIVSNYDQYKFCYDSVLHHLQADQTYMNT